MEQHGDQLLHTALDSYRAAIEAAGEAAVRVDPATGEALQQTLRSLISGLGDSPSAACIVETQRSLDQELKAWSQRASEGFREKASGMHDVLQVAGAAARQVGEQATQHAKRFTEFTDRLQATSKLNDLTIIRRSLGQHAVDLKSYAAQMVKDSEASISQLRAQVAAYE